MPPGDQMAALFVISRIADPSARNFLASLHVTDERERRYVEAGLRAIDARR